MMESTQLYSLLWILLSGCAPHQSVQQHTEMVDTATNHDTVHEDSGSIDAPDTNMSEPSDEHNQDPDDTETDQHFSQHFQSWLTEHPQFDSDLTRLDLEGGSFGGFGHDVHELRHEPILFIHGNSDRASGGSLGGWTTQRALFLEAGFANAELYATTYGPANPLYASSYRHDVETLQHIRDFIEAVLEYTDAPKIDIVTHSLGVTLTRKAILGGSFTDANQQTVHLGEPLTNQVDTFVGIAGANHGLTSCLGSFAPTCSNVDGLYPGTVLGLEVVGQSEIVQNINEVQTYEGAYRFSIWSQSDEILGFGSLVWGQNTARIPMQTDETVYGAKSHLALKEDSFESVYTMMQEHRTP